MSFILKYYSNDFKRSFLVIIEHRYIDDGRVNFHTRILVSNRNQYSKKRLCFFFRQAYNHCPIMRYDKMTLKHF